jgi:hypothetical protein
MIEDFIRFISDDELIAIEERMIAATERVKEVYNYQAYNDINDLIKIILRERAVRTVHE